MGKETTEATQTQAAPAVPQLSLDEFCRRLSVKDKRVELIGAFFLTEQSAGRVNDTIDAFTVRYTALINKPA